MKLKTYNIELTPEGLEPLRLVINSYNVETAMLDASNQCILLFGNINRRIRVLTSYEISIWISGFEQIVKKVKSRNEEQAFDKVQQSLTKDQLNELTWMELISVN